MLLSRFLRPLTVSLLISFVLLLVALVSMPPQEGKAAPAISTQAVEAARMALRGQFREANILATRSGDIAAIKLVELLYLRDNWKEAGYARIMHFLSSAPKWPLSETLLKHAERALYHNRGTVQTILNHFNNREPLTAEGTLALARAYKAAGDKGAAQYWLKLGWRRADLDQQLEAASLSEFGNLITIEDKHARFAALIYKQQSHGALRIAQILGKDYVKAANVAGRLFQATKGADREYGTLGQNLRGYLPLKYALARYYRRTNQFDRAREVLATVPGNPAQMIDTTAWWEERRIIARHSIGVSHSGASALGYRIAANHGLAKGTDATEAEFLAGWIALRSLKDPNLALRHFNRLIALSKTDTERSRGFYWQGRSYAAVGQIDNARSSWSKAANFPTLYYGQLSREQIGLSKVAMPRPNGQASAEATSFVSRDEAVRAFKILAGAGAKQELSMFLSSFANRFNSIDQMNAAAKIVVDEGGSFLGVKLAKAAAARDLDIDYWGYPTRALPQIVQIGKPVETALVIGLARQESEFNAKAGSRVGAQGLMQIMPGTARLIAGQYRLPYSPDKLMGDPGYNVKLGTAHLGDLIDKYEGSYILTLVAYNAGPRRSTEWVSEYGDPRGGKVDPIDWVESIPFTETRQYVQKVMQNVHVYRALLAPHTMRPMLADLKRGGTTITAASDTPNCAANSITALISNCN